jgi:hypothetical protein
MDMGTLEGVLDHHTDTAPPSDLFTLSSGVVLKLRRYNRLLVRDIIAAVPDPEPPITHDEEQGIDLENDADPDYQAALQDAFTRRAELMTDYVLMEATSVHDLPPDMPGPDSDEWLAVAEHIGYRFNPAKPTRYLAWLKLKAIRSIEDSSRLSLAITRLNGTLEEDVAAAVAAFPGDMAG